ncbi:MAG TPA: N-6 DNA methylase [Planctomycetaceae bacterium]|nr:N-6 DNA methylase [Planctomycetaceae bacterium]
MATAAETVYRLTEVTLSSAERQRCLHDFAEATGWYPSDELVEYPGTEQFANGHLLVEHGMANTAVISFLKPDAPFPLLDKGNQIRLLELSYNNLVDWHLLPDSRGLTAVYNRTDPPSNFRADYVDAWRADAFAAVTGRTIRPDLKALDDAFIAMISYWKRAIGGEIGRAAGNEHYSALFNILIFLRAYEDHRRRLGNVNQDRLLVHLAATRPTIGLRQLCVDALAVLGDGQFPSFIQNRVELLNVFAPLSAESLRQLVADFYKDRSLPYRYDFSLISKHALSRIYEHYVSILRDTPSEQLRLFSDLADELSNKSLGSYYTPQYIARFFARYLQECTPPKDFREMRIADPACGSGIFLRTVLELRCDPLDPMATRAVVKDSFRNVLGLDVDASACEATRLSLSLLHLVITDEFPEDLKVVSRDAVDYVETEVSERSTYGAVLANPPYIRWESQSEQWKSRAVQYLGDLTHGKVDAYLALLKAGIDLVKEGGFLMYALPHTFLYAENARPLRGLILEEFWVRLVADLSDLKVFGEVSSYTILLVIQRKTEFAPSPLATVLTCRSSVGEALSTALQRRLADNEYFRVFEVTQDRFKHRTWRLLPPRQQAIADRLERLPELADMAIVMQGVVTGADDVFIRQRSDIPRSERQIWKPLLTDREMRSYSVPKDSERVVFYPFDGTRRLDEAEVADRYTDTWAYLQENRARLASRKALSKPGTAWWRPLWPRDPEKLFAPKIVCPHLMLTPRFGLDLKGRFAVTRSPFIIPNDEYQSAGDDFLKYLAAILNSGFGFWQVATLSHKYSRRYAMVENKSLAVFRLPDPRTVPVTTMERVVELVDERLRAGFAGELEKQIDETVAHLYGMTPQELTALGLY